MLHNGNMWHSQSKSPTWPVLIAEILAKMWNRLQNSKKMFAHIAYSARKRGPLADPIGPDAWKHLESLAMAKTRENDDCIKRSHLDASVTEEE